MPHRAGVGLHYDRLPLALLVAVTLACVVNAGCYLLSVANPVVSADAWYFLDVFVSKDVNGQLHWSDFFSKRAVSDHSQPVNRLILAASTRLFDLDFQFDAMVGFIGLLVCCGFLLVVARQPCRGRPWTTAHACVLCLIPLILFSTNSQEIYHWPLVIQFHAVLPFALALFWLGSRHNGWHTGLVLLLATLAAMMTLDGAGLLACVALAVTLALEAARGAGWRSALARALPVLTAVLLYRWAYASWLPPVPDSHSLGLSQLANALLARAGEAWQWPILPAASSLVHWDHLAAWFGDGVKLATIVLGLAVLVLHALFWRSVLRTPHGTRASFFAVCLMLYIYALTAGIVLGRVPQYGSGYLLQHRYLMFYQLANIALIVQWQVARAARGTGPAIPTARPWRTAVPVVALLTVATLQVVLSLRAWEHAVHIRNYSAGMADTIHCLAARPEVITPACEGNHSVCEWHPDVRNRLVNVLREHRLNVFSPAFQRRHGLPRNANDTTRCLPAP